MLGDQKKYVTVDSGNVGEKASYSVEKAEKAPEKNHRGLLDGGWLWNTSQGSGSCLCTN